MDPIKKNTTISSAPVLVAQRLDKAKDKSLSSE